ncbi:hypothetical protein J7337_006030 [Fusarium musae]|uniref:2EXR domain-containing protein n=1 Tax=Fusarium musae TaxID=1042133 RepID=A0A9P8DJT5_9HYPO|nr:hypothetical protein J7337_006030 [Fusarium musae]KAG9503188.1 hypothetical protein J7337_006030 [Fusarium musae]
MASTEDSTSSQFRLEGLPPELRDLIWKFTLPDCRLFHIKKTSTQEPSTNPTVDQLFFRFHIHYAPPVALRICRESRAVAQREGFFLSPHGDNPGVWFRPETDILYFDRNQRVTLKAKPHNSIVTIHGYDKVLNVGIEWRAFFRDVPRPAAGETMAEYWRSSIESLYDFMPGMRTLNYILPELRHKGGMVWGREPFQAQSYTAVLLPLPERVKIPWETTRNRGNDRAAMLSEFLFNASHGNRDTTPLMVTWGEVKKDIEKGIEEDPERESAGHCPLEVIGWWLIRDGIPETQENPQVQRFKS